MFASQTKEDVAVGDVTVKIRKLSRKQLEEAAEPVQERARKAQLEGIRAFASGSDLLQIIGKIDEIREQNAAEQGERQEDPESRYGLYDRGITLLRGIVSWDAERKLDAAAIDDLDREASEILFRRIVDLSHPTAAAQDEVGKDA